MANKTTSGSIKKNRLKRSFRQHWTMPTTKDKTNPIYPVIIDKRPDSDPSRVADEDGNQPKLIKQPCPICDGNVDPGDLRVIVRMEMGYRRTKNYYFHIHCFLDKFMAQLKRHGYDVTAYVTGTLFT